MLEGVACSDLHLGGLNKHFIDADERILNELDKIYQYCMENGIKNVFIPGDIADTPTMTLDTTIMLYQFFKRYDGKINTFYVCGNHDFAERGRTAMDFFHALSESGALKTLKIFLTPKRMIIDDVPVNFLPYPCLETLSKDAGALNFAHVEYSGAIGDNGRELKTKHELATHKNDFTISGHIHMYQFMKAKRAVYCGNPFQKNFGESLPKGFIHFRATVEGKKIVFQHNFVENKPSFILQNVEINDINHFNKLKNDDNIRYKLHIDPEVPVPPDLRIRFPNITGDIFVKGGKKVANKDEETLKPVKAEINLKTGLKKFLGAEGMDKAEMKAALKEVESMMNAQGF